MILNWINWIYFAATVCHHKLHTFQSHSAASTPAGHRQHRIQMTIREFHATRDHCIRRQTNFSLSLSHSLNSMLLYFIRQLDVHVRFAFVVVAQFAIQETQAHNWDVSWSKQKKKWRKKRKKEKKTRSDCKFLFCGIYFMMWWNVRNCMPNMDFMCDTNDTFQPNESVCSRRRSAPSQ